MWNWLKSKYALIVFCYEIICIPKYRKTNTTRKPFTSVRLSRNQCTFNGHKSCVQIRTAQFASQLTVHEHGKPTYNLSKLTWKTKASKRVGKKGALSMSEMNIVPAPNSLNSLGQAPKLVDDDAAEDYMKNIQSLRVMQFEIFDTIAKSTLI